MRRALIRQYMDNARRSRREFDGIFRMEVRGGFTVCIAGTSGGPGSIRQLYCTISSCVRKCELLPFSWLPWPVAAVRGNMCAVGAFDLQFFRWLRVTFHLLQIQFDVISHVSFQVFVGSLAAVSSGVLPSAAPKSACHRRRKVSCAKHIYACDGRNVAL